ncbi:hypothetical protein N7519_006241 [Penicillium mononematosum]|uniref:uncharacterized protein n=1 Tax=Penicillium mononematosum TaxID=268346 RepID=UPI0025497ACF|nr:uncharacterized protein N7519_006241 [Penicillium mononematosum]KAJ6184940.1 hypothetical protein N7519_006241 [Penicillium mononematosum]
MHPTEHLTEQPLGPPSALPPPRQLSKWQIARQATSRGLGAALLTYWPSEPDYAKIGEPFVVPEAHAGDSDRPLGSGHGLSGRPLPKLLAGGKLLKGQLPMMLKQEPVRELMARERYFAGGRREDEILGNHLVNVEFAAVFCQGEVKTNEHRCDSCLQGYGPWAKCVQLREGEGYLSACANCIWNGQFERCSLWKRAQALLTPGDQNRGHQRNKRSISKKMAYEAWADMKRNLDMVEELTVEIAAKILMAASMERPMEDNADDNEEG